MKFLLTILVLIMVSFGVFAQEEAVSGFDTFMNAIPAWITILTMVVTAATAITSVTPTKTDDVILSKVLRVLNLLSGNVLKNKNADDTP
jgi:uncharacterized protein involved in cysteine biosynthesis